MEDICLTPKNMDIDLSEAFPGSVVSEACTNIQSKLGEAGDQLVMDNEIQSYINTNGQPILYYPYLFQIEKSEKLYGEHSAAGYGQPFQIIAYLQIEDSPSFITLHGFDNDETVTGWIHIKNFKKKIQEILKNNKDERYEDYTSIYNLNYISDKDVTHAIEPKADDLFQLMLYGCDREWDRGNKIYKITNVEDEIFSQNFNPVHGHYIWRITAKRFRPSLQDGISRLDSKSADNPYLGVLGEKGNHLVHDNLSVVKMFLAAEGIIDENGEEMGNCKEGFVTEDGITTVKQEIKKVYHQDIQEDSKAEFDMEKRIPNFYLDTQSTVISNGYL